MGNAVIKYKIWCDISTRLMLGSTFALPACVFCICLFLAQVASPRSSPPSPSGNRRRMLFDLTICAGLPIVQMALYYVVQTNRFDIWEDTGCDVHDYTTIATLFIVYVPPAAFGLGALICGAISLYWFIRRWAQVQQILQSSQSGLSTALYLRLIIYSTIQMFCTVLLTAFWLITKTIHGLDPWVSWDYMHANEQKINQYTRANIPRSAWNVNTLIWYMIPFSSVFFFAFFGSGKEARSEYVRFFRWVFRIKPKSDSALPVRVRDVDTLNLSFRVSPAVTILIQPETTVPEIPQEMLDNVSTISRKNQKELDIRTGMVV
ncbi:Pheromone B beta 1 receptor [Ceratobasidium theobromae]|uniref:Pheromone B beta 1 receptor n=1 Tax=Ceratobasidium theobromae TaxID=1582974 RepID=A0A5N5QAJ3_9AGAM|nr:Pheromone B beta 1 receptor [Ceratobasidium theobromae]